MCMNLGMLTETQKKGVRRWGYHHLESSTIVYTGIYWYIQVYTMLWYIKVYESGQKYIHVYYILFFDFQKM